jgi:hypothetical protein
VEREKAMPSNFTLISDAGVTLPQQGGDVDFEFRFDAQGIRADLQPVLLYRVDPTDNLITLKLEINGTNVHDAQFKNETRSYHEAVGAGVVNPTGNVLRLVKTGGGGSILVSDIVLMYKE